MPVASLLDITRILVWQDRLRRANDELGAHEAVPDDIRTVIKELADEILGIGQDDIRSHDPYLLLALNQGTVAALRGIVDEDPRRARRLLRIALEQMRHALRDLEDEDAVAEDKPSKDVVRWLSTALDIPQPRLALLLGVELRMLQRWLSDTEPTRPQGDRAARVRVVARIVTHLRHALTGPGVVQWFDRPKRDLGGKPPIDLLDDAEMLPHLTRLASQARSMMAS